MDSTKLSKDLNYLQSLPRTTLTDLSSIIPPSAPPKTGSETLESFGVSNGDVDKSDTLVKSYINEMRGEILASSIFGREKEGGYGIGDGVGERIERLREDGEGLKGVLSDVRI